jgi:preprotein translocase subunit YajC
VFLAASSSSGGGSVLPLLLLVGVFALMYFMVIRPQSRRRKQMAEMQSEVAPGAPVMTLGGLYGSVVSTEDDTVLIEVSPGVINRYARAAIAKVLNDEDAMKAGLPAAHPVGSLSGEHDNLDDEYEDELVEDTDDELPDVDEPSAPDTAKPESGKTAAAPDGGFDDPTAPPKV